MKNAVIILLLIFALLLSACAGFGTTAATTTAATTTTETTAAATTTTAATPAATTTATTTTAATTAATTTAATTTAATTTAATTTAGTGAIHTLRGTFLKAEWGDYLHLDLKGEDGVVYSFFVLSNLGIDIETLTAGQKLRVLWQNCDQFLDPPGETVNIDVVLKIELDD